MDYMYTTLLILGTSLGTLLSVRWFWKAKIRKQLSEIGDRRGIITFNNMNSGTDKFNVVCDFVEVERSKKFTKIAITSVVISNFNYNTEFYVNQIKTLKGTWYRIDDSKIGWFEKPTEELRKDNLKKLLNGK